MKIKILNWLLVIDILTVLLVFSLTLISSPLLRFILALPLLLFFPGYALLRALFGNKKEMGALEKGAVSCAMSIAVNALIGFALNYTIWGIKLEPVLYSMTAFIIAASVVAFIRLAFSPGGIRWLVELNIGWQSGTLLGANRRLYIFLIIVIIIAGVGLGYAMSVFRPREAFTEFYILGRENKAQDYPSEFAMENGRVTLVRYGDGIESASQWGEVTLGIVNNTGTTATYSVKVLVDGQQTDISYRNAVFHQVDNIGLGQGDRWEEKIGFAPQHTGNSQKVDFLLYKDGDSNAEDSLILWVDVRESGTGIP